MAEDENRLRKAIRGAVIPVMPSGERNPWLMSPGDCQRALAELWELVKDDQQD